MQETNNQQYREYRNLLQKAADINNAAAVLGWDQEVYMPPNGAEHRGRQLATLAGQAHELLTSAELGNLLLILCNCNTLNEDEKANVRLSKEDYDKNTKLPAAFVEELSRLTSECYNAWIAARRNNDYQIFEPYLSQMIEMKKRQAELYGYKEHPYDALLDEYEKGASVAMLDQFFDGIKEQLPPLLNKIKAMPQVNSDCFHQHYPKQTQWNFGLDVLRAMGYDFNGGRQDYSEHPFTTSFSPGDVRITTRVDEHNFASMLWSCIHEGGHGLYEQGLPGKQYGLPLGAAASLGIHESQSRLWENCIGRSSEFWSFFYPKLQSYFPLQLQDTTADEFVKAANRVSPSLIRTEADELTYHFHVMIRYEIEKALIEGSLTASELPARWNELYHKYLGITPPDDLSGILQDVHWSHGSFGYFPTYTLGSFYAAQLFYKLAEEIPDVKDQIAKGNFSPLLQWLREKIHVHGRKYTSEELCERVTGSKLDPQYFTQYALEKYQSIYNINNR